MFKIIIPAGESVEAEPISSVRLTMTYHFAPGDDFVPTWFQVPDEMAEHFLITDIKIGRDSQMVSTGCIPASLFSPNSSEKFLPEHGGLLLDPVRPGLTISLSATNIDRQKRTFTFGLVGYQRKNLPITSYCHLMGYGSTMVKDKQSANINVQPMIDLRPQFLYVPASTLQHFRVDDLWTTNPNRHLSDQSAEKLKGMPQSGPIRLVPNPDVARDNFLTLSVRNITDHPHNFTAAILGTPVPTNQETLA